MATSHVEEIKERLKVEDVVASYIKLDKSGANFKARCPFHNEKTPSFYVSPDRGSFYCFGCQAKGDIFTFVEKFEGLDFMGALKVLAERAGVQLDRRAAQKDNRKEALYQIMEDAAVFYEAELAASETAKTYIAGRGLTDKTVADFRVGFAADEWRSLRNHLKGKGHSDADVEAVGLVKKSEKAGGSSNDPYYDTFRNRIIFPIADSSGRVVAFTGRTLDEASNPPKYLNSPETVLFTKSKVLFALDRAKMDVRKRGYAIIVEGQMDAVMLHQAGYTNTVAASGTAFVDDVSDDSAFNLLTRLSDNIVVAFDSDSAGQKAVRRIVPAISLGMNVKIVDVKGGKDPADIVKSDPAAWHALLEGKKDFVDYLVDTLVDAKASPAEVSRLVRQDIFPYLAAIPQETPRYQAVRRVADRLAISEDALWKDFGAYVAAQKTADRTGIPAGQSGGSAQAGKKGIARLEAIERKALGLLHSKSHLKGDAVRKSELAAVVGEKRMLEFEALSPESIAELTLEAEITFPADDEKRSSEREYKILLLYLEEEMLRKSLEDMMGAIHRHEKGKDETATRQAMEGIQKATERMQEIKKQITLV
ncbi:MAG: DNA primase [bacterium]|nr:DNA primase [bacterium]